MRRSHWTLLFSAVITSALSPGVHAQQVGSVEVLVGLVTKDLQVRPVPNLALELVAVPDTSIRFGFRTDLSGNATYEGPVGQYRLRSVSSVELEGQAFVWDVPVSIEAGGRLKIELSNANANARNVAAAIPVEAGDSNRPTGGAVSPAAVAAEGPSRFPPSDPRSYTLPELRFMDAWLAGSVKYQAALRRAIRVNIGDRCEDPVAVAARVLGDFGFRIADQTASTVVSMPRSGGLMSPEVPEKEALAEALGDDYAEASRLKRVAGFNSYNKNFFQNPRYSASRLILQSDGSATFRVEFKPKTDKKNPSVKYEASVGVHAEGKELKDQGLGLVYDNYSQLWYPDQMRVAYRIAEACGGYGVGFD
jgi:hypothetical protein